MNKFITYFRQRPWLWIVVGFLTFVGAWAALILIASSHKPEFIHP